MEAFKAAVDSHSNLFRGNRYGTYSPRGVLLRTVGSSVEGGWGRGLVVWLVRGGEVGWRGQGVWLVTVSWHRSHTHDYPPCSVEAEHIHR